MVVPVNNPATHATDDTQARHATPAAPTTTARPFADPRTHATTNMTTGPATITAATPSEPQRTRPEKSRSKSR